MESRFMFLAGWTGEKGSDLFEDADFGGIALWNHLLEGAHMELSLRCFFHARS